MAKTAMLAASIFTSLTKNYNGNIQHFVQLQLTSTPRTSKVGFIAKDNFKTAVV